MTTEISKVNRRGLLLSDNTFATFSAIRKEEGRHVDKMLSELCKLWLKTHPQESK